MDLSGVERLFSRARTLASEAMRGPARGEAALNPSERATRSEVSDGVRLSLSIEAASRAEGEVAVAATRDAAPLESPAAETTRPGRARRGSAIAAYERSAAAVVGERVTIRA